MTDSDFQSITEGLLNADGQLGPVQFEAVMKRQIKNVIQTKLALVGGMRSTEDLEFMQFGALKMVLLEQVDLFKIVIAACNKGGTLSNLTVKTIHSYQYLIK